MDKKLRSILAITAVLTITTALIIAIAISSQPRAVLANSGQPVSESRIDRGVTPTALSTSVTDVQPVAPNNTSAAQTQYPLVQKVKGVKVEVTGTSNEGNFFAVDVCYDLPGNNGEFEVGGQTPNFITLSTSDGSIPVYAVTMIGGDLQKDSNGKYIGRCDRLEFPISPATNLNRLTLTISRISTSPAEILDCAKAQKKLDDAKQKIKVKCGVNKDGIGGGFSVSEKPAGIDADTANTIASDAFIDIVEGPWVFALN